MAVRKFRSLDEAERSRWLEPGDPRIWQAAKARWAIHRAFGSSQRSPRRGVARYRSIEEKQREDTAHRVERPGDDGGT
jgi:hypothetical protein